MAAKWGRERVSRQKKGKLVPKMVLRRLRRRKDGAQLTLGVILFIISYHLFIYSLFIYLYLFYLSTIYSFYFTYIVYLDCYLFIIYSFPVFRCFGDFSCFKVLFLIICLSIYSFITIYSCLVFGFRFFFLLLLEFLYSLCVYCFSQFLSSFSVIFVLGMIFLLINITSIFPSLVPLFVLCLLF